ncbi:hypothetical protein JCM9140_2327 [Halalkalibacter wakoensis JCM 9140]|uniref:Uncharacterized protein n=1 Tax=Halalkalibacter wakoensis JCM 9140 TaxID=1236970 RepID=W4Q3H2_9BACI|nr:hypothetical protein [Halalkalibacter wakoensis]GAE26278.1 hypothetical protein JCM9140_2327 [Halalkalibacter wakoensis JCM 9140]
MNRVRVKVEEDDVESSEVAASSTGYSEVVNVSNGNFTATFNDLAEGSFVATVIPLAGPVGHEVDLVSFGSSNWSNSFDVPDQSSEPEEPTDGGSVNDGEDENEEGSNPITIDDAFVDWSITAITGGVVMEAELDAEAIDVVKEIQINFDLEGGSQEEVTLTKPLEESDGNAYRRAIDLPAGIHEYTISALNGSGDVVGEVKAGSVTVSVLPRWQQQPGYLYVQSGSSGRTETELFTVVGNFSYSRLPVDSLGRTQSGDRVNVFDGSMIRFDLDRHRMSDFRIVSRQSLLETNGNPASHHYITPFVENYQGAEITVPIR